MQLVAEGGEGSEAVLPPMAIVWPCSMPVESYASAGRDVEVPVLACPACAERLAPWSGYWRFVRHRAGCVRVFVPRGRCGACACTHALLPGFCVRNRLDTVETIGVALEAVARGAQGVRPAAEAAGVPHTTVRGWVRRFAGNAVALATGFAALAAELGGEAVGLVGDVGDGGRWAVAAIGAAWRQAMGLPGWLAVGRWRFCSSVCGGSLLAANTNSPYLVVGRRRFMPPVP